MTPGPARRIVTVLPRNKPTPIAPPIAIIAIWRGTSLRRRPSSVAGAANSAGSVICVYTKFGHENTKSPTYVVSAFRRTRHGPAKAGHYVREQARDFRRSLARQRE